MPEMLKKKNDLAIYLWNYCMHITCSIYHCYFMFDIRIHNGNYITVYKQFLFKSCNIYPVKIKTVAVINLSSQSGAKDT